MGSGFSGILDLADLSFSGTPKLKCSFPLSKVVSNMVPNWSKLVPNWSQSWPKLVPDDGKRLDALDVVVRAGGCLRGGSLREGSG